LRNRDPERVADRFLDDVRNGRNSAVAEPLLASQTTNRPTAISTWKLAFREDQRDTVRLYYRLDYPAAKDPARSGGEGMLEMRRTTGTWRAADFNAIF
jgi:hypothetical protein